MTKFHAIALGGAAFVALVGGGFLDLIAVGVATATGAAIGSKMRAQV